MFMVNLFQQSAKKNSPSPERAKGHQKKLGTRPVLRPKSHGSFNHHLFDIGDRLRRVQTFGASLGTVHDCVAPVKLERILKVI
jgi:hypothetical protein